jgi:hypothetical protein
MWMEFLNMTVPALVGSGVTLTAIVLTNQRKNKKLNMEVDAAQDFVWLDLVKQSRIEYALQRKENNRLRYITHHLQEEVTVLEQKNSDLQKELMRLRTLEE